MCYNECAKNKTTSRRSEPWHILTLSSIKLPHFSRDMILKSLRASITLDKSFAPLTIKAIGTAMGNRGRDKIYV